MILVIDYGMGNIGSLLNMIKKVGGEAKVSSDLDEIRSAKKIILPGVGSFDNGMKNLNEGGFSQILTRKVVNERVPFLGVCLGMQLLSKGSEEGKLPGLGWFDAKTVKFKFDSENEKLKIPHMGWNNIEIKRKGNIYEDMYEESSFYFVHSYHIVCEKPEDILSTTFYGNEFVSSINKDNIYATQFHPEKSHKFGMKLMHNFIYNT